MKNTSLVVLCFLLLALPAFFLSCRSGSKRIIIASATDQQKKIDSLTAVLHQNEEEQKKQKQASENRQAALALVAERNLLPSRIQTDKPSFTRVALGGFQDIHFNLFNNAPYKLDQVTVKVHYFKASGVEIKTELVTVPDVLPGSKRIVNAPDYLDAGTYLTVSIQSAVSKAINLCYDADAVPADEKDPFKCR
jgi:hypothetical protein